jgi:hypothetical protein
MPCKTHQSQMNRLIDGHLDAVQIVDLRHRLESDQCNQCLDILESHLMLTELSHEWQEHDVPDWNRAQHIIKPTQSASHWTSFASLALSTMAIILVLTQFQIHSTEHGVLFSFAGQGQERIIAQRVESTLKTIQAQQKEYIDAKLVNLNNEQSEKNRHIINAVVELNRTERRQEMVKLVHFLDNKNQLNNYQQNINNAVNYQPININSLDNLNDADLLQPKGTN